MSENPSRRSAEWPPPNERGARGPQPGHEGQRREPAAWEPQPRATPRGARPDDQRGASRDDRTRRGGGPAPAPWEAASTAGYDDRGAARGGSGRGSRRAGGDGYGGYGEPYADDSGARSGGRGGLEDYQRGPAAAAGRRGAAPSAATPYDDYDTPESGSGRAGTGRRGGTSTRSGRGAAATAMPLGTKAGTAFLCAAVTALVLAFLCATASSGGSARSIAGISLNSKLIMSTLLALPVGAGAIAGLLKWRRVEPLGLTWGYGAVAGLSWLSLLFMAQVKNVIPHLPPFLTVPLAAGAAFAVGAALTDDSTTVTGRYACLAAVIASHIGIVAIVVTIVLA